MIDLKKAFQHIQNEASNIAVATATAEATLDSIRPQLVGRRFEPSKLGNLKGIYEITDVDLHYDGEVHAHGRKVTSTGKLGSQRWDLGQIYPGNLRL